MVEQFIIHTLYYGTAFFNVLLTIIVESNQKNVHADSEVVCCILTTTIEQ